jgi:hypothetical protein
MASEKSTGRGSSDDLGPHLSHTLFLPSFRTRSQLRFASIMMWGRGTFSSRTYSMRVNNALTWKATDTVDATCCLRQ